MSLQYQRDAVAVNNDPRTPVPRQMNGADLSCGHRLSAERGLADLSVILSDRCQDEAAVRQGCPDRQKPVAESRLMRRNMTARSRQSAGRPSTRPESVDQGYELECQLRNVIRSPT